MEFRRKQINKLVISAIIILFLTVVVIGQKKENNGYLFGHVVMGTPNEVSGELLPGATIELLHLNKRIIIITDEAGVIDKKLPAGKYQLLSVKNSEGKLLTFSDKQYLCLEIETNKTTRFDIDVLKPTT
jgi:hypothetical protein